MSFWSVSLKFYHNTNPALFPYASAFVVNFLLVSFYFRNAKYDFLFNGTEIFVSQLKVKS